MSYFSNLLTSTTSRYNSFRRNLLSSSSEDDSSIDDPETSHVSRVLRAYYIEKDRPFPPWLGPDPRSPVQTPQPQQSSMKNAQGSLRSQNYNSGNNAGLSGGGLSDLFADGPGGGRFAGPERTAIRSGFRQTPDSREASQPPARKEESLNVRPLPSQRAGSYQAQNQGYSQPQGPGRNASSTPPSSTGLGSMQERLKARLAGRSGGAIPSSPEREETPRYDGRSGTGGGGAYDKSSSEARPYGTTGASWGLDPRNEKGDRSNDRGYNGGLGYGRGSHNGYPSR